MENLEVRVTHDAVRAAVALRGELDETTVEQLRSIDIDQLFADGCREIAVDLDDVEFLDSSGIGSLVSLYNRAARRGVPLRIDAAPVHVRHTLTVAGLAPLFGLT